MTASSSASFSSCSRSLGFGGDLSLDLGGLSLVLGGLLRLLLGLALQGADLLGQGVAAGLEGLGVLLGLQLAAVRAQ